jgi:hypothetical protein
MSKRYVYKNVNKRPVNIGGYQFEKGQELESDVLINGFNEAVSNGFLTLAERNPETVEPDATQAQQTGGTGKVKVTLHLDVDAEGKEILKELELDPSIPIEFPAAETLPKPGFEGWFEDTEFAKAVKTNKAKTPKEGEVHFYAKFGMPKPENTPPANPNPDDPAKPNEGTGSGPDQTNTPAGNKPSAEDTENK